MTLPVTFRRAARAEFIEAAAWYEAQRPNLGVQFIAEVERCVALAAEQPQLYAVVHKGMRRVTAERFPYSVYFCAETRRVVVLAVFHGSRDPAIWAAPGLTRRASPSPYPLPQADGSTGGDLCP